MSRYLIQLPNSLSHPGPQHYIKAIQKLKRNETNGFLHLSVLVTGVKRQQTVIIIVVTSVSIWGVVIINNYLTCIKC